MSTRKFMSTIMIVIFTSVYLLGTGSITNRASAQTTDKPYNTDFITDQQLEDYNSMSQEQIQAFLTNKGSYLKDPISDTDDETVDVSEVIVEASQEHQVNPRMILARIQTESGGVTKQTVPNLASLTGCATTNYIPEPIDTARGQIWCTAERYRTFYNYARDHGKIDFVNPPWEVGVETLTQDEVEVTPINLAVVTLFAYNPVAGGWWGGRPLVDCSSNPDGTCGGVALFYTVWKDFGFDAPPQPTPSPTILHSRSVKLAPATDNPDTQCYRGNSLSVFWDGQPIFLSSKGSYKNSYAIDDKLRITILHVDDGTTSIFERDSVTQPQPAEDFSTYLHQNENRLNVEIVSTIPPRCGGSELFLVPESMLTNPPLCEGDTPSGLPGVVHRIRCVGIRAVRWLRVTVFRNSDAEIALVGPDGKIYNRFSPGVVYSKTDTQVIFELQNPQSGDWEAQITALETDPEGSSFHYLIEELEPWNDITAPVTLGTLSCSRDMTGVCRSEAIVNFAATDDLSGVDRIECSFNDGSTWDWCGDENGGQLILGGNGRSSFLYRAVDFARNVETANNSGIIDIQRFIAIANTHLIIDRATTVQAIGDIQSNDDVTLTNNTKVTLDRLQYIGQFTENSNVSLTIKLLIQVIEPVQIPLYPLSFYRILCRYVRGPITINDTSPIYDECIYVDGDVTIRTTTARGKWTVVSEGVIYDQSTNAHLEPWDTLNGVLFYGRRGYITRTTGAIYNGILYTPYSTIEGPFTNFTMNGGMFSKTISLGSGTTLSAQQAAGFPASTYDLPLVMPPSTSPNIIYVSSTTGGTAGGVSFADEDVLAYNREQDFYSMYIDGSDIGLGSTDIDAFAMLPDGTILLSFDGSISISGLGSVYDADIVRFTPTSLGSTTAGSFEWYFDGSDVGITTSDEDIDAIDFTPDGKLVISTVGSFSVPGVSGNDEDLIVFTATQLGATTSGTWAIYFDGSDVGLNESSNEDVNGIWIDMLTGDIFLTTVGSFSVNGLNGDGADIFICIPGSLGSTTSCTFGPRLYWDGSTNGFAGEVLDAFTVSR